MMKMKELGNAAETWSGSYGPSPKTSPKPVAKITPEITFKEHCPPSPRDL